VLTGIIKANFPARISFQVSSKTDSRTILDANGAEQLLGKGDMLFLSPGTNRLLRIHGAYVSEAEIQKVTEYIRKQGPPDYRIQSSEESTSSEPASLMEERDDLYEQAVQLVIQTGQASASFIQRRLRVGYPRAARMIEMMEEDGIIGPAMGSKAREVLAKQAIGQKTEEP
jgi:S-DNA-T family DNA segregation ATPase FtsK/SpoIIIE